MKRATPLKIIILLFLLIATDVFGQEISQSDFYGLWEYEYYEDFPFNYFINSSTLIMLDNFTNKSWSYNILSWQPYINESINTRNDYPYGFILNIKEVGSTRTDFTDIVFIHRDKNRIIFYGNPDDIYLKK